jgi:tetratricopeptide (TPR) repeat protein
MRLIMVLLAAVLGGCAAAPAPQVAPSPAAAEIFAQRYPLSPQQRATTSSSIYLGNLDARIEVLDDQLQRGDNPAVRGSLAAALLLRFRIIGRVADGERALELAAQAASAAPDLPDLQLVHAAALSAFHRFAQAEVALSRAQAAGADASVLARLRRDVWMAQGRYDRLQDDFARSGEPVADFYELAHRADLRLMQGDLEGASRWYRTAQDFYHDVDPLPLAWLYAQQGIALLRHGRCDQAQPFFEAAYQRLPEYYLASEHLAECEARLGNVERARELYHAVIAQTGNPEFVAALADLEHAAGQAERAAAARKDAEDAYRVLLARQRAAYAQHAAEFLLDIGKSDEALLLARDNLVLRQDVGSLILMASAAAAAGQPAEACAAVRRARATGLQPPEIGEIAEIELTCKVTATR